MKEIVENKRREVDGLKRRGLPTLKSPCNLPVRDFKAAISKKGKINLIAEIKFASPSAGVIREKMDPCAIGHIYEEAGAAAISLITDQRFFGGSIHELPLLKRAVSLPILRKDFIVDEIQVRESLLYGADAVLLIARILSREKLNELFFLSKELGLTALTEVHDRQDLETALDCGADLIGINNRNLETFDIDLQTTYDLAPQIPAQCTVISESGISHAEGIRCLRKTGIRAVLVGTSLMNCTDVGGKVRELADAGAQESSS